jgi:hypothetical protein
MAIRSSLLRDWARRGAAARLVELRAESAAILKSFPDLKRSGAAAKSASGRTGRPRRVISAAAKRAMSAGMRRYWARRKKLAESQD